jgi:hypothetical protein
LVSFKSDTGNFDKNWLIHPGSSHLVKFYDYESQLINSLSEFIAQGLANEETCIVIATERHRNKLEKQLAGKGVLSLKTKDQFIVLDACETLDSFMVGDMTDWDKFRENVEIIVAEAARQGKPIRAFGEMVAILWQSGNTKAVMKLEQFWNNLAHKYEFYLYCAYPMIHFDSSVHRTEAEQICKLHSHCGRIFGKDLKTNKSTRSIQPSVNQVIYS